MRMGTRRQPFLLALALTGIAACGEDGGKCGPTGVCAEPAAELRITRVLVGPEVAIHPETRFSVVDSLNVTYVVHNTGNAASLPVPAVIEAFHRSAEDTVPALQPGDSTVRFVRLSAVQVFLSGDAAADRFVAGVRLTQSLNDSAAVQAASDTVHIARPILQVSAQPLREPRLRVNDPVQMEVTLTNLSAHQAARDIQLRHCLWDIDVACYLGTFTAFGTIAVDDLAPGESRTIRYTTAITPTATYQDEAYTYRTTVCLAPNADDGPYRPDYRFLEDPWVCGSAGRVTVWPDYEACEPAVLRAEPVLLAEPNCGLYPTVPNAPFWVENLMRLERFFLFALDAEAGRTYSITGISGTLMNANGQRATNLAQAPGTVSVEHSGRYYIIVRSLNTPQTGAASMVP